MTARLLSLASLALALAGAIGYFSLLRIPAIRNHFAPKSSGIPRAIQYTHA